MATYRFYEGGNGSNANNAMLPSANNVGVPPMGYADHQKARTYMVTRWLDFRKKQNYGNNSLVDVATPFYVNQLAAAGTPLAATDILSTHLLLPKTKLRSIFYEIVVPAPAFQFDIILESNPGTPLFNNVSGAAAGYALLDTAASMPALLTAQDYIGLRIDVLPTGGFVNSGLLMYITAEVLSYDDNGNQ